jgi:uncharacterized repeat protein (TIGR03803 family)
MKQEYPLIKPRLIRMAATAALIAALVAPASALAQAGAAKAAPTAPSAIYSFGAVQPDAADPKDSLTYVNGLFFGRASGTTQVGGLGAIFHFGVSTDVPPQITGYTIDHLFTGRPGDGANPRHDAMTPVSVGGQGLMLFGTTFAGGAHNNGTIFEIGDDGTGYNLLYSFHTHGGIHSHSCFVEENGVLYGATAGGGAHRNGVIFSVKPDGSGYKALYSFAKKTGSQPHGRLTLSAAGDQLYGMTKKGGAKNLGVVFQIDISGKHYTGLHDFTGSTSDGASTQHGYLVLDGSTLYGMTTKGGQHNLGVVFSIGTDGKKFTILHSFGSTSNDGHYPYGSLMLIGATLFGTTAKGGSKGLGTVFEIGEDGSGYKRLHDFTGGNSDGVKPIDNVIYVNGYLYGLTTAGGQYNDGTIFQVAAP